MMALPENKKRSPLEDLSYARFGGRTYGQEKITSVPITRIDLLPNNPNRVYWRLINEGANDVRVSTAPNVSSTSGWLLQSGGGLIEMTYEEDGEVVGYTLYAIANAAAVQVRSLEVVRE